MDGIRFDQFVKTLSAAGTRRDVLRRLSALTPAGALAALLAEEAGADKRRRTAKPGAGAEHHRHKGRRRGHKNRQKKHRKNKCRPWPTARTCAGTCGAVKNNCKKTVDCGSCACEPACLECFTCQEQPGAPGSCVPTPGGDCGQPGQICQSDGACACDASSCAAGQQCLEGVCVCTGTTCAAQGKNCGNISDGCGDTISCGSCSTTQACKENVCIDCGDGCIALEKRAEPAGPLGIGDTITYTFDVANIGQADLINVEVNDQLPGLTWVVGPDLGNLGAGDSAGAIATYVVTQADVDAGEITNVAIVTATAPDGSQVAGEDSVTVPTG